MRKVGKLFSSQAKLIQILPIYRYFSNIPTMPTGESKCYATGSAPPPIDENKLTVYSMRFCPYAERVLLLLNVKHVPYDVINIHLKQKPEWYLVKNPLGKVPAIEVPGKAPLFESLIVAEYLDDVYPGAKTISSKDPYERARQKVLIEVISQKVNPPFYAILWKTMPDPEENLLKGMDYVEKMLDTDYFAGESMGFVDLMIWPWFERLPAVKENYGLKDLDSKERYPKLMAWTERMLSDPDIKFSKYPTELMAKFFRDAVAGQVNYDEGL